MKSAQIKIIELAEYEKKSFKSNEITYETAINLYEKYQTYIDVDFPTPKTNYRWYLVAKGTVGYIPINSDLAIKINPKVPIKNLLGMLEYAYNLKSFNFLQGLVNCDSLEDFYNHLAYTLAEKILARCRKGLYRDYIPKTERLAYVRGRINLQQTIQKPWDVKLKCQYDEHTADVLENKILLWTIFNIGHSGFCLERVSLIVRKVYHALQGLVNLQFCKPENCINRQYNRLNSDYEELHYLCRFFLENTSPSHKNGENKTLPFLVNMHRLYELFVAEWLKRHLPKNFFIKLQERINIGDNLYFQPDLIIYESSNSQPRYILDTKYKVPKTPSSDDVAQVVAYAQSKNCQEAVLIYPSKLNNPVNQYVGDIRVRCLTFSLENNLDEGGKIFLENLLIKMPND
jgi:5-methylcytosine-specific restriction enzyme subunit McrC